MKLRATTIDRLAQGTFDVLVLGGGINGAVAAAALSARGAKVALIDRGDFAGATSQESSNLAWGGIKYMETFELTLVRKLCKSRNRLIRSYPSTVQEIRFYAAHPRGLRHGLWKLVLGAWLYWLIGSCFTRIPRLLSRRTIAREEPIIRLDGCDGGFEYSDAYLHDNDARFVWGFIRGALDHGCAAANYVESLGARREDGDAERGADLHQAISVSFDEAIRGGQRAITVTRQEHCGACRGTGRLHVNESACPQCHGSGIVKSARGHMVFSKPCAPCGGSGRQRQAPCPACNGQRVHMQTEPLTIAVPPGLADGARIRVPGKGHAGRNGGEAGDVYVTVHVPAHAIFRREGDDLHLTVPVAVHEAALGAKIEVPSLDGPLRLRVPPGTQAGQRFRLRERGVASRDGHRGDLVVEVRLVLPKLLDERSKELLREFGRINAEDVRKELT